MTADRSAAIAAPLEDISSLKKSRRLGLLTRGWRDRLTFVGILLVAALVRLAWIGVMPVSPQSDFAGYYQIAQQIAHAQWPANSFGWTYEGPGYPILLAPLIRAGGGLDAVRLTNVALQLVTVAGVWMLGRRLFGRSAAVIGAAIAALFPGMWVYTPLVAAENLAMLLLTAIALLLCRPSRSWQAVALGAAVVALALTRPAYLPFALVALLAAVWTAGRVSLARVSWLALGVVPVFAPVAYLDASHHGPVLARASANWELWLVNNERATGAWFPAQDSADYPFKGLDSNGAGPADVGAAQSKLAVQFILANPVRAARGLLLRHRLNWAKDDMGLYWTVDQAPPDWQHRVVLRQQLPDVFDKIYAAVLALAAISVVRYRRRSLALIPIILPLAYLVATLAVAEGNGRYHVVALPLL